MMGGPLGLELLVEDGCAPRASLGLGLGILGLGLLVDASGEPAPLQQM